MVHDSNMILTLYQLPHIYVSRVYPPGYAFVRAQFHFGYSIFAIFGLPSPAVASVHRLTLVAECITILFDRKNIDFLSRSLCRNGMVELFGVWNSVVGFFIRPAPLSAAFMRYFCVFRFRVSLAQISIINYFKPTIKWIDRYGEQNTNLLWTDKNFKGWTAVVW